LTPPFPVTGDLDQATLDEQVPEGSPTPGAGDEPDPDEQARDAFQALVERALAAVPLPFSQELAGVAILIEDDPAPGQGPPGRLLFGLYEGVPRTAWGADGSPYPSRITIFRRPHELAYPDPAARAHAVESTVLHEVAHHLGTDEERIRAIEAGRRGRS
jgi:predicted Zn-dependent protease with MMP-like domain